MSIILISVNIQLLFFEEHFLLNHVNALNYIPMKIILSIAITYFSLIINPAFSQCSVCRDDMDDGIKSKSVEGNDLATRYPDAKKIKWRKCPGYNFTYAIIEDGNYTRSVIYDNEGKWIATESRVYKPTLDYDYEKEKVLNKTYMMASTDIYPKEMFKILKSDDYSIKASNYKKAKNANEYEGMCDFYTIEFAEDQNFSKKYNESTAYIMNIDGVILVYSSKEFLYETYTEEVYPDYIELEEED